MEELDKSNERHNVLTVRLTDAEHTRIVDTAWMQRRSASSLLREAAADYLRWQEEIKTIKEQSQK